MSERNHSLERSDEPENKSTKRWKWGHIVSGTVAALLIAGIVFQILRAEPGAAQSSTPAPAGKVRIGGTTRMDEIVARVNNEPITWEELARVTVERHGKEVLDNLINRRIIEQECDRNGIQVTKAEIEREVLETANKFNLDVDSWYALLKTERGIGKNQYHRDVIFPMLALKKLAGQNITVTEEDMRQGFERRYGSRVEARMILVKGTNRQAAKIWQQVVDNPEDFSRLAREHSADPNTRPLGSVIPPIARHSTSDQIEKEAFRLRVGEISPLIEIGHNQYVILKCEGHTKPIVTDIREVQEQLYQEILEEKTQEAVAKIFEIIKKQSSIVNYITGEKTAPTAYAANPTGIQQTSGTSFPGDVRKASIPESLSTR